MTSTAGRMAASRRSRFLRTPRGKRVELTERDLQTLRWLYRYRYLSTPQLIRALQPKSHKRFIERLGDLFHETGLIDRPIASSPNIWNFCFGPMLHEISDAGIELLSLRRAAMERAVTFSRRNTQRRQLAHCMLVIETLLTIELETSHRPDRRFVSVDEILSRAPQATRTARNPLAIPVTIKPTSQFPGLRKPWHTYLIPDALYGIEYLEGREKLYRFFALECDRTTPAARSSHRLSSIAGKRVAYAALKQVRTFKTHWGIPNLEVRFLGEKPGRKT